MKNIIKLLVIAASFTTSCAQTASAPEYLINQSFPEDIKAFKLQNTQGLEESWGAILEKHQGKKVVIDFWASWCKDCLVSLPNLQKLQKETPNVDYVFLSLDKTKPRWLSAIKKLNIQGDHYFMPEGWKNTLTNYIGLDWIPRYMILDEKGKVILAKAVKVDAEFKEKIMK